MYNAIDLFCGCGGMTEGLKQAGFKVIAGIEIDENASTAYRANHTKDGVVLFQEDIRHFDTNRIKVLLGDKPLHLLAGCPPCQGFSSMRRKNKKKSVKDPRNSLILEYLRFVDELRPITIMLENVPALSGYSQFKKVVSALKKLGYNPKYSVVNVSNYGVPQRRKRLILVGSLLGDIQIAEGNNIILTVRDKIEKLENVNDTIDQVHKIFPTHTPEVLERIRLTPHDGGSRSDLPDKYTLECHKKDGIGFHDVYGRLRWDTVSSTITGGCLNPSKGRFLHPVEDRCITAREAALLQTFPRNYIFPTNISRSSIALMIGNALPPEFCKQQGANLVMHLDRHFLSDICDKEKRSEIMSRVRNRDTEPELIVRELLCELGFNRYRLKTSQLNCNPDIVFPNLKKAIYINGCFWHGHNCNSSSMPKSNIDFWQNKISKNIESDQRNYNELKMLGWECLVIWQCEVKVNNQIDLRKKINDFISSSTRGI